MPHSMAKAFPTASFPVNALTDCTLHPSPPARSVFAVMVSMPMHHRVACLRDDVVFSIFLYQLAISSRQAPRERVRFAYERDNDEDNADVGACTADVKQGTVDPLLLQHCYHLHPQAMVPREGEES